MENKSIRLRTKPGSSQNIQLKIDQEFDFLEILSLKISQEELYSSFCANYGVIIGRVIANKGFGIPNSKVSIFVPISSEDEKNTFLKELYPYKSVLTKNSEGKRYNLLLSKSTCSLNSQAVGSFPTKSMVLDNDIEIEIFEKYYKYTTRTNTAGDYMIFGVPTGTHVIHMDVDLSDAGVASIRPYDLIADGFPKNLFQSSTEFKVSNNLDSLPQIKSGNIGTDVIPFWGDEETCDVGITRIDFDTNFNITPNALFFGSIFTDDAKMSLNKRCNPKNRQGELDRLRTSSGDIKVIRVSEINNVTWANNSVLEPTELEDFKLFNPDVTSISLIDDDGNFALPVPMNVGHMITNEFGELVPSSNPDIGVPTKGMYRFAMKFNEPPANVKRRTATVIFPSLSSLHGGTAGTTTEPQGSAGGTEDQRFTTDVDDYADIHLDFQTFEWKQIYTISQFIKKYKKGTNKFSFLGLKNTDNSTSNGYNPMPYTTMIWKGNIIYAIFAFFVKIASAILQLFVFLVALQFGFAFQLGINTDLVKFCFGMGVHIRPFSFISQLFPKFSDSDFDCPIDGEGCPTTNCNDRGFVLECSGDALDKLYCVNLSNPCPGLCDGDCVGGSLTNGKSCCEPTTGVINVVTGTKNYPNGCLCEEIKSDSCVYAIPSKGGCSALQSIKNWECCVKINSAEKNETMRRCFFDAWLTGSAYLFQFKYKQKIKSNGTKLQSFCGPGSDRTGGDNYKRNQCCPNGSNPPYKDGTTGNPSDLDGNVCPRCLLRGPSNSKQHKYIGIDEYHKDNHDNYDSGPKDLDDIIYCNAYYSTKIVNLGRIEMCEDVLFEIEKCITSPNCGIDQYVNDVQSAQPSGGVGTFYEDGWDQNFWVSIMQETSYQDPIDIIYYLLTCAGCKCKPKKLFHRGSSCHEREIVAQHDNNITIHPYNYIKELSKIYTDIILDDNDEFVPGQNIPKDCKVCTIDGNGDVIEPQGGLGPDEECCEMNEDGSLIQSGLEFNLGIGKRFSPCGNIGVTSSTPMYTDGNNGECFPTDTAAWDIDYEVIGRPNAKKNIPYFYFGLIAGKTSINKIRNLFFQNR